MRRLFTFLLIPLMLGCAVRQTAFSPIPIVPESNVSLHENGLPAEQNGCGWVVVEEENSTKLFGLTLNKSVRHFERALFYCCPGESDPDPKCYQADWYYRDGK